MALVTFDDATSHVSTTEKGSGVDMLTKNWQTTAAVTLGVATGGAASLVMLSMLPAQTLTAGAAIGALLYAGDREEKDLPLFPFGNKQELDASDTAKTVVDAETVTAQYLGGSNEPPLFYLCIKLLFH